MKPNAKIYRQFAILCWFGTAISVFLTGYMLRMTRSYPEIGAFARNTRIAGVLMLLWMAAAVFFTVRAIMVKKK